MKNNYYHIVCNASFPYIKYLAVLIKSIIINTPRDMQGMYVFHVMIDANGDSHELDKLHALILELNNIYPCKLCIKDCSKYLDSLPIKVDIHRIIYARLFLARMFNDDVKTCLYLDADMLALGDVRALFSIDLQGHIIGAVRDIVNAKKPILPSRVNADAFMFSNRAVYVNSGLMLISLDAWRKHAVEERAMAFLRAYKPHYYDQDVLNAVLEGHIMLLDMRFNAQVSFLNQYHYYTWQKDIGLRADNPLEAYLQEPIIIHYVCEPKPWQSPYVALDSYHMPSAGNARATWWEIARKLEGFKQEFRALEERITGGGGLQDYALAVGKDLQQLHAQIERLKALLKNPVKFIWRYVMLRIKHKL